MHDLKNKVAIVTGGANGIGASIVREFVKEGVKYVAILDVVENTGAALENELNTKYGVGTVCFFKCDVTKSDQLYDVFNKVKEAHGGFDILVNNAAIADDSRGGFKLQIEVNFLAVVTSSFKALELMRVDQGGKGGTIINVSSVVALSHDLGLLPVYAGTKSAILQFSCRLGMDELNSRNNVRVLTMCFGATDTNILKTCKSFDEEVTEVIREYFLTCDMQSTEAAAQGVVHSYKTGNSGTVWLIDKNTTLDITDKIKKANEIMSADLFT
ncbi:15-hydroxyprostaglandin dehydrogenase [NAD(+)]-like [Pararge aegeria]|uniref:Jg18568 protein n=1 Tax=Pararge aegeria aegeria TaxID=348720 RepID=A0A8S4RXW8_9NEOP|nr:15-hydroxyprostaglandin dehydrogenase [NAD(+)]-like [Pararge aegeria]CAH2243901.1 jg18568 [Pararge aegeria aegeria]